MLLSQGLARAAQSKPNGASTIFHARRRTWRETSERVARLAGGLRQRGLRKGDRAAILALNSDRYFEYLFAVPAAGGVTVPMNIRLAVPEISYILQDSGATMLFVDAPYAEVLQHRDFRRGKLRDIVYLDDDPVPPGMIGFEDLLDAPPFTGLIVDDDDTAGIFYTGGTTGQAKGVMLSHRNLVANAANIVVAIGYNRNSVYLHAPPMFHAADGASTLAVTMQGGVHVFTPRFEPAVTAATIEAERVTHTLLVPTMVNALVNHPDVDSRDLASLEVVSFGASPMPDAVLKRATEKLPGVRWVHLYGMTEAAPLVTALAPEDALTHRKSCGKAALLVEVRVADLDDHEVPRGTVGELQVRGPNVMLGYWNKPEQTAEALRGSWYHSGDGAYMDDDGYVYIVDRLKDMIISGGENIYSAEVESAISLLDGVAEVAVIGIPDEQWGEVVHAIVVPRPGHTLTAEAVIAHARAMIAHYKCPRTVELREAPLPLSGAGKVLKTELRKPFWEGHEKRVN